MAATWRKLYSARSIIFRPDGAFDTPCRDAPTDSTESVNGDRQVAWLTDTQRRSSCSECSAQSIAIRAHVQGLFCLFYTAEKSNVLLNFSVHSRNSRFLKLLLCLKPTNLPLFRILPLLRNIQPEVRFPMLILFFKFLILISIPNMLNVQE